VEYRFDIGQGQEAEMDSMWAKRKAMGSLGMGGAGAAAANVSNTP